VRQRTPCRAEVRCEQSRRAVRSAGENVIPPRSSTRIYANRALSGAVARLLTVFSQIRHEGHLPRAPCTE
jgi:hypothetical protein